MDVANYFENSNILWKLIYEFRKVALLYIIIMLTIITIKMVIIFKMIIIFVLESMNIFDILDPIVFRFFIIKHVLETMYIINLSWCDIFLGKVFRKTRRWTIVNAIIRSGDPRQCVSHIVSHRYYTTLMIVLIPVLGCTYCECRPLGLRVYHHGNVS
jgi:hypothetical protein